MQLWDKERPEIKCTWTTLHEIYLINWSQIGSARIHGRRSEHIRLLTWRSPVQKNVWDNCHLFLATPVRNFRALCCMTFAKFSGPPYSDAINSGPEGQYSKPRASNLSPSHSEKSEKYVHNTVPLSRYRFIIYRTSLETHTISLRRAALLVLLPRLSRCQTCNWWHFVCGGVPWWSHGSWGDECKYECCLAAWLG